MQSMSPSKNDPAVGKANLKTRGREWNVMPDIADRISARYIGICILAVVYLSWRAPSHAVWKRRNLSSLQSAKTSVKLTIYLCYVVDFRILIISERIVGLSDEINMRLLEIRLLSAVISLRVNVKQNVSSCSSYHVFCNIDDDRQYTYYRGEFSKLQSRLKTIQWFFPSSPTRHGF